MPGLAYCVSRFALLHRQLEDNLDLQLLLDEAMHISEAELHSCQSRYLSIHMGIWLLAACPGVSKTVKVVAYCKPPPECQSVNAGYASLTFKHCTVIFQPNM